MPLLFHIHTIQELPDILFPHMADLHKAQTYIRISSETNKKVALINALHVHSVPTGWS